MAILSGLLSITEPSGFWITIIRAFEAVTNNYVLAIIFLTVVIRLIWGLVDTLMKYSQQSMNAIQMKMKPEMDRLQAKYANQPDVLKQKQNEISQKYMGKGYMGSCAIMFIVMGLNLLIFFTLFAGLNSMSAYRIATNYDSIKYTYANCLNVTNEYYNDTESTVDEKNDIFADYENLRFVISTVGKGENEKTVISLVHLVDVGEGVTQNVTLMTVDYKTQFVEELPEEGVAVQAEGEPNESEEVVPKETDNTYIIKLIERFFPTYEEGEEVGSKEIVIGSETVKNEAGEDEIVPLYLSTAIQRVAMKNVVATYDANKESFLWIENIWIADSPMNQSIVSFDTLKGQVGKAFEDNEKTIYDAFMPDLKVERSRVNGYLILTILCILVSFLSMNLSKLYNKHKNKKNGVETPAAAGGKWMQIIMPLLLGIFALFYNSVFAIYMLVGQIVSCILMVPQLMFVDFIIDRKKKKEEKKVEATIDYSRKF